VKNIWVLYALLSAFFLATSDAFTKRAVKNQDEYLVAWFRLFFTLPVFIPILLFIPVPAIDNIFYIAFFSALPLEVITVFLYVKAIKTSPLNLTLPFLSLTPLFLTFIPYILYGERISTGGIIGIILIVTGGYILNVDLSRSGIMEPVRAIFREKGSIMMIIVAFIYSFTSSLGKIAIEHSSPLFFGFSYFLLLTVLSTPLSIFMGKQNLREFVSKRIYKRLVLPGFFYALMVIFHMLALDLTKVAYMISVKRLSLIIGVIYGYILFKEESFKQRLLGTILMLTGFVILVNSR